MNRSGWRIGMNGLGRAGDPEITMVYVQKGKIVQTRDKGPHLVDTSVRADILAFYRYAWSTKRATSSRTVPKGARNRMRHNGDVDLVKSSASSLELNAVKQFPCWTITQAKDN